MLKRIISPFAGLFVLALLYVGWRRYRRNMRRQAVKLAGGTGYEAAEAFLRDKPKNFNEYIDGVNSGVLRQDT